MSEQKSASVFLGRYIECDRCGIWYWSMRGHDCFKIWYCRLPFVHKESSLFAIDAATAAAHYIEARRKEGVTSPKERVIVRDAQGNEEAYEVTMAMEPSYRVEWIYEEDE